jgi:hypothetical protein
MNERHPAFQAANRGSQIRIDDAKVKAFEERWERTWSTRWLLRFGGPDRKVPKYYPIVSVVKP